MSNNNCEYASDGCCLCSACQAAREAMKEAEKVTKEEVDRLFCDAEKMLEDIIIHEREDREDERNRK